MGTDEKRYEDLSEWAEQDHDLHPEAAGARHGEAAAAVGRDVLRHAGGRPGLDPDSAQGHHSPRRQVRLPQQLSDSVDDLATQQGRKAAEVMRDAITEYVSRHKTPA